MWIKEQWKSLTMISVPTAFAKRGHMAKRVQEANPSVTLHAQRLFLVRVISLNYWVLHSVINLETHCYEGWEKDSHLILNRSPEPLWEPGWEPGCEPELLEPEELPLPGLGTSFSTLSHSRRGSILLYQGRKEIFCHTHFSHTETSLFLSVLLITQLKEHFNTELRASVMLHNPGSGSLWNNYYLIYDG